MSLVLICLIAVIGLAACADDSTDVLTPTQKTSVLVEDLKKPKPWREYSNDELFKYVAATDSTLIVGLRVPGKRRGVINGRVNLTTDEWNAAKSVVGHIMNGRIVKSSDRLPAVRVRAEHASEIAALRRSPFVDYVEPAIIKSGVAELGCSASSGGSDPWSGPVTRTHGPVGDIIPWNSIRMKVPEAWRYSQGAGVTIGLIDTGVSGMQIDLTTEFAAGESAGRSIWRDWVTESSFDPDWVDDCGHGTHMAGTIVAPKNGRNIVGIAYRANFVSVRHHDDVWNSGSAWETAAAIDLAAGTYGAKILVMAFMITESSTLVEDMISYWWNADRLFVAAAGTSICGGWDSVVFPATMHPQVIAVSGWNEDDEMPCTAHRGPEVDVLAYIEQPSTGAFEIGDFDVVGNGGTSNGSAVIAGIAALVWSRYPTLSNWGVRTRLLNSIASFGLLGTNASRPINALCAVGGLCLAEMFGPALIETNHDTTATYTIDHKAADAPAQYTWYNGATTSSITIPVRAPLPSEPNGYMIEVTATVTDPTTGAIAFNPARSTLVRAPYVDCPDCMRPQSRSVPIIR